MFPGVRTNAAQVMHPITRPVYMYTGEVPHPVTSTVAVARTDEYVSIRVHPGSPTPRVASDIAADLYEEEGPGWIRPFGFQGAVDLAAIRADPVGVLGPITLIPAFAHLIPVRLRLPWAPWMYN